MTPNQDCEISFVYIIRFWNSTSTGVTGGTGVFMKRWEIQWNPVITTSVYMHLVY